MNKLSNQKSEKYRKLLTKEFPGLEAEKIEQLIDYLFELAKWEVNVTNEYNEKS